MKFETPHDDGVARGKSGAEPDAHGQAALLLAESIIHTLIEAKILTATEAVATVQMAAEVKVEVAELAGESRERMEASLFLLETIAASFETDIP